MFTERHFSPARFFPVGESLFASLATTVCSQAGKGQAQQGEAARLRYIVGRLVEDGIVQREAAADAIEHQAVDVAKVAQVGTAYCC